MIPGQTLLVVTFLLTAVLILVDVFVADWVRKPDLSRRRFGPPLNQSVMSQGHSMGEHGNCCTGQISLLIAALGRSICRR